MERFGWKERGREGERGCRDGSENAEEGEGEAMRRRRDERGRGEQREEKSERSQMRERRRGERVGMTEGKNVMVDEMKARLVLGV